MNVCSCGQPATANDRECPSCFRARLASIQLDTSVVPTRTRRAYYDSAALDETFGEDRVDTYWSETKGHGAVERVGDKLMHRNFRGEVREADDRVLADLTAGEEAADVV